MNLRAARDFVCYCLPVWRFVALVGLVQRRRHSTHCLLVCGIFELRDKIVRIPEVRDKLVFTQALWAIPLSDVIIEDFRQLNRPATVWCKGEL